MGAVGNAVSGLLGGNDVASAQGAMSMAQLRQQQADRAYLMPTQAEQDQLKQALATNNQSIQQSQALLASADPALIQAGQQALQLMQGKSAAALAPLQNQRSQQRAQLEQQLAQQLGPGYRTSSAGIQALNNFDQQSANVMNQAQQGAINQFMGYATNARLMGGQEQQQGITNEANLTKEQQNMRISAVTGAPIDAGLSEAGNLAQAKANQSGISTLLGVGGGIAAAGGFSKLGDLFGPSGAPNPAGAISTKSLKAFAAGGVVPGEAPYPDEDRPDNDVVRANVTPGEGIIPLTHMKSKQKAVKYVMEELFGKKGNKVKKGKKAYSGAEDSLHNNSTAALRASRGFASAVNGAPESAPQPQQPTAQGHAYEPPPEAPWVDPDEIAHRHAVAMEQAQSDPRFAAAVAEAKLNHVRNTMERLHAAPDSEPGGLQGGEGHWKGGKVRPDKNNNLRRLPDKSMRSRRTYYA